MSETCQELAFTHPIVVLKCGLKNNWMKKLDRVPTFKTIASKELYVTPCFDVLSYLCEYLLDLLELS